MPAPRICIDLTANETFDRHGGIARYGWALLEALVRLDEVRTRNVELLAVRHTCGPVMRAQRALERRALDEALVPMNTWKRRRTWELGWVLRRAHVDLFHAVQPAALPVIRGYRVVSTIHDIIPLIWPEPVRNAVARMEQRMRNRARWWRRTRGADHLIAISQQTAKDLRTHLNVHANRVSVVPHGVDMTAFGEESGATRALPPRYFISVSSDHPRKNQESLFEGFARASAGIPESLVLVGRSLYGKTFPKIVRRASELGLSDRVLWLDDVTDTELPPMLRGARAAIAPSLYEGFGMTLLEAMACGTAVAAARNGAHEEVASDAALFFDGRDSAAVASVLRKLSSDDDAVAELRLKGLERVRETTWDVAARRTMDTYLETLR